MVEGIGKTGGIVGIVSSIMSIVTFSFSFLLIGFVFTIFQYSGDFSGISELVDDPSSIIAIIIFAIYCGILYALFLLQVITLSINIKYIKTGRHKVAAGVLNILSLSVIGIIAGVLILVYKGEQNEQFNYNDYVEA